MSRFAPQHLLLLSAFLHAGWNTVIKVSKDKEMFVFLTVVFACLAVSIPLAVQERSFSLGGRTGLGFSLGAGLFEGGYLIAMAKGFTRTSLAKAYSIMRGSAMVFVWAISLLLSIEHFSTVSLVGSVVVLIGIGASGRRGRGSKPAPKGETIWPLLGGVFIAGYHLCYGESLRLGAEPKALFLTALATSLPFIFLSAREDCVARAARIFRAEKRLLLISSIGSMLSFVIFLYGLQSAGPGYAITLRNTSIFFSIVFSFLIRDKVTKYQIVGATLIGIGALLLSLGGT